MRTREILLYEKEEKKKIRVTTFVGKQIKSRTRRKKLKKTTTTNVNTDMCMKKKGEDARQINKNSNNKYSFKIYMSLFS